MHKRPNDLIWKDRKRHFGLPLSFTEYYLTQNRIFCESGILSVSIEEVLLYRVRDLSVSMTLWQRMLGVGTVRVISADKTAPLLVMENVRNPRAVKELLYQQLQNAQKKKKIRATEMLGDGPEDMADDSHEGF